MSETPKISVIVPFYNAAATLVPCLESILANDYPAFEVICVDDRSTDNSAAIVASYPVKQVQMLRQSGAAAARNQAAQAAEGEIFYFADADVILPPDILSKIGRLFTENDDLDACFGAYTIFPADNNFASVYKNLIHHYTHLTSNHHASTFWCGCGAIRRQAFENAEGFNEDYSASSVEDIDLGYRLTKQGANIRLVTDLRVTHAKRYTLWSLIKSDVLDRAIPWTKLMAHQNIFRADLNLKLSNIASGILLALFVPMIIAALFFLPEIYDLYFGLPLLILLIGVYFALNARLWWYVLRAKGLWFSLLFGFMLIITYLYSVVGFAVGLLMYLAERLRKKR